MRPIMAKAVGYMKPTIDSTTRLYVPFNEGVGTVAKDYSQYGNHAQLTDVEWSNKGFNGAGKFNGSSAFGNCDNDPSLSITDVIMIEVWMKPDVLDVALPIGGKGAGWHFTRYSSNTIVFSFKDGAGAWQITLSNSIINLNWHHVIITREGAINKIYIDGVLDKTQTIGTSGLVSLPANTVNIGKSIADNWCGTAYFSGTIDEVRIYNQALSAAQTAADCYEVVCN